jgi:alpha-ketoglutarate-dependent taurine dioxygenase
VASGIKISNLSDEFSFGSTVAGVTYAALEDPAVRAELNALFEKRALIVFTGLESSGKMQVTLSQVFGPLKEHPTKNTPRADADTMPGVIDMHYIPGDPNGDLVELDGETLARWSPWHFDHCYNDELNRAGVLRALIIPPIGGLTGFADGIDLYNSIAETTRRKVEKLKVIYTLDTRYSRMRFGLPKRFRNLVETPIGDAVAKEAESRPRALHPMVWQRASGEKVLHVSPWMAVGIEGRETAEGDALLEEICQEMLAKVHAYQHRWQPDHMLIWDNWRLLHNVSGGDPRYERRVHRTTIKGDYGLGSFETSTYPGRASSASG